MIILWILSISTMIFIGVKAISYFSFTASTEQSFKIKKHDFLNVEMKENDNMFGFRGSYFLFRFYHQDDQHKDFNWFNRAKLEIKKSEDSIPRLKIKIYSQGKSVKYANQNAQEVNFEFVQEGEDLILNGFSLNEGQKYRAQRLKWTLYLPINQKFHLDSSLRANLRKIDIIGDFWISELINEDLMMTREGVLCLTCEQ